jgi:uncharacterized glyoxalase superfamily protein PhnB
MEAVSEAVRAAAESSDTPRDMPWISPYLTVKDASAALEFYEAAFGFTRQYAHTDDEGVVLHAKMTWHEGVVMFGPEGAYGGTARTPATTGVESPVTLYVFCADVDALFERAVAAGATVGFAPMDTFWGDRLCGLADPDGHVWQFATRNGIVASPV